MKQETSKFRVLVSTALFGTVRVSKGDVIRRELLGCNIRKLIDTGVIEPVTVPQSKRAQVTLL